MSISIPPTEDDELVGTIVPQGLWITMFISVLLLIFVGGMLFFRPDVANIYWAWKLTPFNTRFLGAIYLSAIIPLLFCLINRRSAPLRIVLPLFAFFTTYLLIVSCAYIDNFYSGRTVSKVWFFLYGMDSFVGIYYMWSLRKHLFPWRGDFPAGTLRERFRKWFRVYRLEAIALAVYGIWLLILSPLVGNFWAWNLDSFHARLYSGLFLASALGLWLLSYSSIAQEHLMLNLTQTVLGGLICIGLWVVDVEVGKINWNSLNPWIWSILFFLFSLTGSILSFLTSRKRIV